jgi:hypothetical protein
VSNLKPLTGAYVRAANEAYAGISLSRTRPDELTIELEQLRAAIETVRQPIAFDTDPSDFRAALLSVAKDTRR